MSEETRYTYPRKPSLSSDWMIVDIETVGRTDVSHLLEAPEAAKNLKDPDKIRAEIEQKTKDRDGKLALDMNTCKIVAIGIMTDEMSAPVTSVILSADDEAASLNETWSEYGGIGNLQRKTLIGFCLRTFDIPVMMQRTRLLGMPEPALDWGRYSKEIIDLAEVLACGDPKYSYSAMSRKLKNYCTLFGIPQDTTDCDGNEIDRLYKAGDFEGIRKHCEADVVRTYRLAKRLGVVAPSKVSRAEEVEEAAIRG